MSQQLARVFDEADLRGPRGPDACLSITVPSAWMRERAWIEVVLPRLLSCQLCQGGGCDGCERSGAVTTRARKAPVEAVAVQLPGTQHSVTLRLPRYGGLPLLEGKGLERGVLMLTVHTGETSSEGVKRLRGASIPPPASLRGAPPSASSAFSSPDASPRSSAPETVWLFPLAMVAGLLSLLWSLGR